MNFSMPRGEGGTKTLEAGPILGGGRVLAPGICKGMSVPIIRSVLLLACAVNWSGPLLSERAELGLLARVLPASNVVLGESEAHEKSKPGPGAIKGDKPHWRTAANAATTSQCRWLAC